MWRRVVIALVVLEWSVRLQAGTPQLVLSAGDSSDHRMHMISVAPGVLLEVLDWGGAGPPVILLASFGNTAHVFDDFAPLLTRSHRVIGITRRGIGRSGAPQQGYTTERLAQDVVAVAETMNLARAVVIGHGSAGYELRWLGTHHRT